jgi:hypothetical protein
LILPLGKADVNWRKVTSCQRHAANGLFAMAMAGFVQWIAKDYQNIVQATQEQIEDLHRVFLWDMASRTAMIAANLVAGLENFLMFAQGCGAIEQAEFDNLWSRAHEALRAAAQSHKSDQDSSDPVQRFRDLLAAAFHSGRAHVTNRAGEAPNYIPIDWGWERQITVVPARMDDRSSSEIAEEQQESLRRAADDAQDGGETTEVITYRHRGERVGWWDFDNNLYLLPDVALAVVQRLAQAEGRPLLLTDKTLGRSLDAKGKLKSHRSGRYTKQIIAGGAQVNVFHVDATWINPWNADPLSKEEQEEQDEKYGGLLA